MILSSDRALQWQYDVLELNIGHELFATGALYDVCFICFEFSIIVPVGFWFPVFQLNNDSS